MRAVDLHTHSRFSDGALSPTELVEAAQAAGVEWLALTDHDSLDGLPEAQQAAAARSLRLIAGIELSTQWVKPRATKPISLHVVGLDLQDLAPMHAVLVQQQHVRAERARAICQRLEKYIKRDAWPDVLALADGRPDGVTRAHVAQWLVDQGIVTRHQQAFDRFLGEGKGAYVPLQWMALADAIGVIRACGGQAVLAHPTRYGLSATNIRHLVAEFASLGGQAIELPPRHEPTSTRGMIDRLIDQHALMVSCASDFHGPNMPWLKLGQTPIMSVGQRGVWEAFAPVDGISPKSANDTQPCVPTIT